MQRHGRACKEMQRRGVLRFAEARRRKGMLRRAEAEQNQTKHSNGEACPSCAMAKQDMYRAAHLHAKQMRNIAVHRVGKAELGSGKVFRGKASAKKSSPGLAQAWLSKVKPRQSLQPDSLLSKGLESKGRQRQSCAGHPTAEAKKGETPRRRRKRAAAPNAKRRQSEAQQRRGRTRRGSGEARHVEAWELRSHAKRRQGMVRRGSGAARHRRPMQMR